MQPWLIHGAAICGRIIAFLFACLCFYLALFMYQDEQGRLQNRLVDLWVAVQEQADKTNSITVALFNKIASIFTTSSDAIFGEHLVSFRTLSVSVNSSMSGWLLCMYAILMRDLTLALVAVFAISVLLFPGLVYLAIRYRQRWVSVVTLLPFLLLNGYSVFSILVTKASTPRHYLGDVSVKTFEARSLAASLIFFLFAVLSDVLAIVVARKAFKYIAASLSIARILQSVCILVLVFAVELPGPFFVFRRAEQLPGSHGWNVILRSTESMLMLNAVTSLYLLIPAGALVIILVHRLFWPALARIVHSASNNRIFVEKKVLLPLGGLAVSIAFNIEKIELKDIVKLFS